MLLHVLQLRDPPCCVPLNTLWVLVELRPASSFGADYCPSTVASLSRQGNHVLAGMTSGGTFCSHCPNMLPAVPGVRLGVFFGKAKPHNRDKQLLAVVS